MVGMNMVKEQTGLGARRLSADPFLDKEPGKAASPLAGGGFCRLEAQQRDDQAASEQDEQKSGQHILGE